MSELLNSSVDVDCPECGRNVRTTLRAVKNHSIVTCSLGHRIQLQQEGRGIQEADRAMEDFERSINDLNRKLKRFGR
jgi:hypothetical protein